MIIFYFLLFIQIYAERQTTYTGSCGDSCTWTLDEETKILTLSGTGKMKDYAYKSNDVEYEPYAPFIETVVFEGSIESIGAYSFDNLVKLKTITIPPSVTSIGEDAFRGCKALKKIKIPNTVTTLGTYTFTECPNLEEVEFEEPVQIIKLPNNAFKDVKISEFVIPNAITELGGFVFQYSRIRKLTLSDKITTVSATSLVSMLYLEEIIIPESDSPNFIVENGLLFNGDKSTVYTVLLGYKQSFIKTPEETTIIKGNGLFEMSSAKTVVMPENMNEMGTYIARYSHTIQTLTLPDSLTSISEDALNCMYNMKSISMPLNLKTVEKYGMNGNTMKKVSFISDITTFNQQAFAYSSIKTYNFYGNPNLLTSCHTDTFKNVKGFTLHVLEEYSGVQICNTATVADLKLIYENTLESSPTVTWKVDVKQRTLSFTINGNEAEIPDFTQNNLPPYYEYLDLVRTVVIPEGITKIGDYAFYEFAHVSTLELPSTLKTIGNYAFATWQILEEVTIPASVESIALTAFNNSVGLGNIIVEDTNLYYTSENGVLYKIEDDNSNTLHIFPPQAPVKTFTFTGSSVPSFMFGENSQLETLTFTYEGEITIDEYAFDNCYRLKTINFEAATSVVIKDFGFANCTSLETFDFSKVTSLGKYSFTGCMHLTSVTLSDTIIEIPDGAFKNCTYLSSFTFGSQTTTIGNDAFRFCLGFIELTIPATITTIGKYTFAGSDNLKRIIFEGKIESMGQSVFEGCSLLEEIDMSQGVLMTSLPKRFCSKCISLQSITIPKEFTILSESAFYGCTMLKTITFEDQSELTEIQKDFCNSCISLESIHIPEKVITLGETAFAGCASLTDVVIPKNIEYIKDSVFENCERIEMSTLILKNIKEIGKKAISGIPLTTVVIGKNLPNDALMYETFNTETLQTITLFSSFFTFYDSYEKPEGDKLICNAPRDEVIEVIEYYEGTIDGDDDYLLDKEYINMLEAEFNIEIHAMKDCGELTGYEINVDTGELVVYGSGSVSLNDFIKEDKYKIKAISFTPLVTSIEEEIFADLPELVEVTIPSTLTSIGENAFKGCPKLVKVHYYDVTGEPEECSTTAFNNRNVDYLIIEGYTEPTFCGVTVYPSEEDIPKPDDPSSGNNDGASSLLFSQSFFFVLLVIMIFI